MMTLPTVPRTGARACASGALRANEAAARGDTSGDGDRAEQLTAGGAVVSQPGEKGHRERERGPGQETNRQRGARGSVWAMRSPESPSHGHDRESSTPTHALMASDQKGGRNSPRLGGEERKRNKDDRRRLHKGPNRRAPIAQFSSSIGPFAVQRVRTIGGGDVFCSNAPESAADWCATRRLLSTRYTSFAGDVIGQSGDAL